MNHEDLFRVYQNKLDWARRLEEFWHDDMTKVREAIFFMYQDLRYYCENGFPTYEESFFYDESLVKDVPPHKLKDNDSEFPAIGILKYRGNEYVIYDDDYGMQSFIVVEEHTIPVSSFAGDYDWEYELDRIIDRIYK